jgi:lipopolysaccharide biosynthesis regulator YciM
MTLAWWLVILLASGLIYSLVLLSFERRHAAVQNPAREHYYAGLRALLSGEEELAFKRFRDSVREDSQIVDAYLRIGELLRRRGQVEKSLAIHQDLAERQGMRPDEQVAIRRALASDHLAMGQRDEARRLLSELTKDPSAQAWAVSLLHREHLKDGEFEEAYKRRKELVRLGEPLDPSVAAVYLALAGYAASEEGEHRRGRVLVRDALKVHAASPAAHLALGELYERDGRREDAVRAFKAFLDCAPELSGLVFPRLEKVLFDMGQYSEIAGIYKQVLAADSTNTDALLGLARYSDKKGDHQSALAYLARIIEADPGHLLARQLLVQIHRDQGSSDLAWRAAEGYFTWLPAAKQEYRCSQCSEKTATPRWYCPNCHRFLTYNLGLRRRAAAVAAETVA